MADKFDTVAQTLAVMAELNLNAQHSLTGMAILMEKIDSLQAEYTEKLQRLLADYRTPQPPVGKIVQGGQVVLQPAAKTCVHGTAAGRWCQTCYTISGKEPQPTGMAASGVVPAYCPHNIPAVLPCDDCKSDGIDTYNYGADDLAFDAHREKQGRL